MHDVENGGGIPAPIIQPELDSLRFSFKHLDLDSPKFSAAHCTQEFFHAFMAGVRDLSLWTIEQFCDQNNNEHRHIIWFPETTEPEGFPVDREQLQYHECWQFQLCRDELWRIHGILIDDTFYVVWLDPNHQLYPL